MSSELDALSSTKGCKKDVDKKLVDSVSIKGSVVTVELTAEGLEALEKVTEGFQKVGYTLTEEQQIESTIASRLAFYSSPDNRLWRVTSKGTEPEPKD
ncbi:MAG: hypothetical protein ACE5OZ_12215 [Candidatus Heimdallarchaeota archaeon]